MKQKKPETVYLKDYKTPAYRIVNVDFQFDLAEDGAVVRSRLECALADPGSSVMVR